jgi:hypothetical protein
MNEKLCFYRPSLSKIEHMNENKVKFLIIMFCFCVLEVFIV